MAVNDFNVTFSGVLHSPVSAAEHGWMDVYNVTLGHKNGYATIG